ncbi:MAG TPA: hypothetical protein VK629_13015 [Steroidobacteraceae bacterium]|nr:hypothetical protein [Steroidobacteraceae bacterium]
MSLYVDSDSRLHHDQASSFALICPHCQVLSHLTPVSVPSFSQLASVRPKQVGIVYRCDSCSSPIFLKFAVKMYASSRVELSGNYNELERPPEKFSFTHLSEECETLFREALICYTHGAFNAFASLCRRVAQAAFRDLGNAGKLKIYDQLTEIRDMAELDHDTFALLKKIIFGTDADAHPHIPELDARYSAILLETMKDLLYQSYIRRGKLQQAMMVRRFFVDQNAQTKVTPIKLTS